MTIQTANSQQNTSYFQAVTGAATVFQARISGPVPAGCFLMLFDLVPPSGVIPNPPYNYTPVVAQPLVSGEPIDFGANGRPFVNGVYMAISARNDYLAPISPPAQGSSFDVIYA